MTLVELLVAAAVITLVFGGLLAAFQLMVSLIGVTKAETGALALANERMEYIRSLPYDSVGTMGGIPQGPIPQNTTRVINGVTYNERVLVEYIDAPEDGEGADDMNGILADYKLVKIEYTWEDARGNEHARSLISNIIPRGIETTAGGGTLTVNVFDTGALPVDGAAVRLVNTSGTTTIDTIRFTNDAGIAMFAGAPALANYEITVTKNGYSTDQTYAATAGNPNPTTPHVAVIESEVSTMNFQIDALASLSVRTVGMPVGERFEDAFDTASGLAASSSVAVSSGALVLAGGPGSYASAGEATGETVAPGAFASWDALAFDAATSSGTDLRVQVYAVTGTSTYALVPDADLPGNGAGFAAGPVDLSSLSPASYPSLALHAILSSNDPAATPALSSWELSYTVSEPVIPNVPFSLTLQKTIGTTAEAAPVYKWHDSFSTDSAGERSLEDLEWGVYAFALDTNEYDIAEACPSVPLALSPGAAEELKLVLADAAPVSLRVLVEDANGALAGAAVRLHNGSFDETIETSSCGQAFFAAGVAPAGDYTIEIFKSGYAPEIVSDVEIGGTETISALLSPS